MRSFISSFSLRIIVFVAILTAAAALGEQYCRTSRLFVRDFSFIYVKLLANADASGEATQAVLGDSHVGWVQHMPGYAFLGQPAQQPEELLLLVHYLYDRLKPRKVILSASPQWFGWYNWDREKIVTPGALAPNLLGFHPLILSRVYSRALFDNVVEDGLKLANSVIPSARAEIPQPGVKEINEVITEWATARGDLARTFIWSTFPLDRRHLMTTGRVFDQNPVKGFRTSTDATAYRKAIEFLLERGAEVCLFRTPVTADYLAISKLISDSRYDEFDQYIKELRQSVSVRYVHFQDLPFEFDDSKFFNQDHMNDQAAEIVWPLVAKACFGAE